MRPLAASTMQVACAVLLLCSTTVADAQTRAERRARASLGRQLGDSLSAVLQAAVNDRAFPGAYAVVGDSRGILAEYGAGRLDWKKSPRPTRQTLWDLASLTKVIGTTTALAQLVEKGAVSLDAAVQQYVPEWSGGGRERVTVRQLLTHSSGLPAFRSYDQQTHDPDSLEALLFNTLLERQPGERMVYSDIGAFMMGEVVERVSGLRLDEYVQRHISQPLRLRETVFNPSLKWRSRIAPTEVDSLRGGLVHGKVHDERAYYLGGVAAHAGLFGSARDVARFAMMMLRGGTLDNARVLKPETITQFTDYAEAALSNRALGWDKPARPEVVHDIANRAWAGQYMSARAFGHTGFTGTSIGIDPELDIFVILLSNRVNPTRNNPKVFAVRTRLADAVVTTVRRHRGQTLNAELRQ